MLRVFAFVCSLLIGSSVLGADCKPAVPQETWYAAHIQIDRGAESDHGSGTPIDVENGKTFFITNSHVVENAKYPISVIIKGKKYPAKYVVGHNVQHTGPGMIHVEGPDLCIVSVDTELDYVKIASSDVAQGGALFLNGFGPRLLEEKPTLRSGQRNTNNLATPTLTSTLQTVNGDSGSGVFNQKGQLVGVHWGGASGVAYAESLDTIQDFILQNKKLLPNLALKVEISREIRR